MEVWYIIIGILAGLISVNGAPHKGPSSCGYDSCPVGKPGVINVHVVPHTHDDVGWLKTVDQYYYGANTSHQLAGVQYVLDSIVRELKKNQDRRFIYVEMGFFWQWWEEQTEDIRTAVKELVEQGRLEFINGGWCMNDEAATHYNDIVDQMTWGLRFLSDTFGECGRPKIAWQIDPFGHSREQASLFASMGYDGLFFARLDWEDKQNRLNKKEMEMIWKASNNPDDSGSIFTGALYDHYSPPDGFCFDVLCNDAPIIDNKRSPEYNVPEKMDKLISYTKNQASQFNTNQIMFTMGNDFNYMSGNMWFKNMDKMIKYANEKDAGVHMFYSTPSCYVKALNEAKAEWPTKSDDFFPYSNDPHSYWTGYFTSRPSFKGMVRKTNTLLQSTKQLHSLSQGKSVEDDQSLIDSLRRSMGEAQHHDAVAGTEKQHVANDYALRLHDSSIGCQQDVATSLNHLLPTGNQPAKLPEMTFCLQLNVSQCQVTENEDRFVVTAYNPRSQKVSSYVRLPVTNGDYTVLDPIGSEMVSQLVPIAVSTSRRGVRNSESKATHELVFYADALPPLGHKSFYVQKMPSMKIRKQQKTTVWRPSEGENVSISNRRVSVNFDENGLIKQVVVDGAAMTLNQNLLWYYGRKEQESPKPFDSRPSGAYVFRPNGTDARPIADRATLTVQTGILVSEVHQKFNEWASQVIRIYRGQTHVEIEWTVGPIPIEDDIGKEIVNRVASQTPSNGIFYTDSNGRQTLKRTRNYRPTWTTKVTEPVSGNYYPINSHIYLTNSAESSLLALVTDRSQGGTSLHDGQLELMVHRRLLYDDHYGVGEPLNEPGEDGRGLISRGTHYLVAMPSLTDKPMSVIRPLAQHMFLPPWLIFNPTDLSFLDWKTNFHTEKSGLMGPLPDNVHILTLEPWKDGTHLLRLEHVFDFNEDATLSQPITVSLKDLFADYEVMSAEETTLGANQWLKDATRFSWTSKSHHTDKIEQHHSSINDQMSVMLNPMDIKSFVIRLEPKNTSP